ncbi:2-hydroxycarboxylate transporter family protein [Sphingomonas sp. UYP23]
MSQIDEVAHGRRRWWALLDRRVGIVPVPLFVALIAIFAGFVTLGTVKADILVNIALLSIGGFACAEIGKRLPVLRSVGAAAILATFLPSWLVYAHVLPKAIVTSVTSFTKDSNFLYLFIACVIVGSILGMDRRKLIAGFLRIFVPLFAGSVAATGTGLAVGAAFGLAPRYVFFYLVAPIMAGGVGEGAIPLSLGYAAMGMGESGVLLARILPAVMFGSLTAILLAGGLNALGKRRPNWTGEGRLSVDDAEDTPFFTSLPPMPASVETVGAATLLITTLYLAGSLCQVAFGFPAPVMMLALAVACKLWRIVSPELERGTAQVASFFRIAVTYPLLFAIGVALTPWDELVAAFHLANIVTIFATVTAMVGTGFVTATRVGLYPIDAAIVTACHSGQGGTGDVAILTAANRMQLMPFAQIATRIAGAIVVTITLILYRQLG